MPEESSYFAPTTMDPYHLPATDKTPTVRFIPAEGLLEIAGCSIHENADRFFRPLLERVAAYAREPMPEIADHLASNCVISILEPGATHSDRVLRTPRANP